MTVITTSGSCSAGCGEVFFDYIPIYCHNCNKKHGGKPDFEKFLEYEADRLMRSGPVLCAASMDYIFDCVNNMLCAGEFAKIDSIVGRLKVCDHETQTLMGLLTITLAAKNKLKSRNKFYWDIRGILSSRLGTTNHFDRLLDGLK